MFLALKFFIGEENTKKVDKNQQNEFPDADQIYWKLLSILKDRSCLIIFDNCNEPMMFKELIQDFLEKLPGIKMIVTCTNSIPCFNDVNN